jgi:hypothetical protein
MGAQIPDGTNCVPFGPGEIHALLKDAPFPWWIAGGWAIDLFLGRQTRPHFDIDVAIARQDQLLAQAYLTDWDFWTTRRDETEQIVLDTWQPGQALGFEIPAVWARETESAPWRFELILHEIHDQTWTFRYNENIQHPLGGIGGVSSQKIPYLQPEIALLLKAARRRDVDEQDFQSVLPRLNSRQREQLAKDIAGFEPDHAWLALLA